MPRIIEKGEVNRRQTIGQIIMTFCLAYLLSPIITEIVLFTDWCIGKLNTREKREGGIHRTWYVGKQVEGLVLNSKN